ncbi:MAG TPA: deoxynucleoside kinase [Pseudomonadales bacterium]|nr:deoxynucleoside kinase [Pseudomonadales bacterium]
MQSQTPKLIAIEGPIGVGKTTLAKRLAETLGSEVVLENVNDNPFLDRFYQNRRQAALATQLFFLFQRSQQIQDMRQDDLFASSRVFDFLMQKDRLFAKVNLDDEEFKLYEQVYQRLLIDAPKPDLVVYLQAPTDTLVQRIEHRGVHAERGIERDYLDQLNQTFSEFFLYYDESPLLIVNSKDIDFANSDDDYNRLVEQILNTRRGRHFYNPTLL